MDQTSLAAGVGASVRNRQFLSEALNLPRKILIMGTFDPAKVDVTPNEPRLVLSPEDVGARTGFGFMLYRLAFQVFEGCGGVPVYIMPQEEAGGADAADGSLDFTGSAGVLAGTLYLYIAGLVVPVAIAAGLSDSQIATVVIAAINSRKYLPVTAAVDGVASGQVNVTAKSKGPWGNLITLDTNLGYDQSLPTGVVVAITAMTGGAGVPDVDAALAALGTGDSANEGYFTDVVHGYGQESLVLDAISEYVGAGNEALGLYGKTVARPFRSLTGDTATGSEGLTDLISLTDGRKLDRANGVLAAPNSPNHPSEIAAQAMAHMARINQDRVAQHYVDIPLIGILPGVTDGRWTNDYNNRDIAVKSGVSPTRVHNGVLCLQNVVTFYRPDNVPVNSNGYRSMRNIAIIQNMLMNVRLNFEQEKWQGVSIVSDVTRVTNMTDRQKARDVDAVKDDLVALARSFETKAWIFTAAFTIRKLKEAGAVVIRPGGIGFDSVLPVIFSGEGGILDTVVEFDTSLAVLLN